jgi:hypothetical protein
MVNLDNAGIIPEIVNSVAVAYNWKNFYRPERRTTSFVSDALLNELAGQFHRKKLKRKILIRRKGTRLEMRQELELNKGEDCFENIFFTSD